MPTAMTKTKFKASDHPPIVPAPPEAPDTDFLGQRRLIRPTLPLRTVAGRQAAAYGQTTALTARSKQNGVHEDSSHAEVFYFQKQIQAQTRMVVVLENGDQIEGVIEWYDRYAIKLRHLGHSNANGDGAIIGARNRMLIYKDGIRYIYKTGENGSQTMS